MLFLEIILIIFKELLHVFWDYLLQSEIRRDRGMEMMGKKKTRQTDGKENKAGLSTALTYNGSWEVWGGGRDHWGTWRFCILTGKCCK